MLDIAAYDEAFADFAHRWRVAEIALFGSALRDDFGPESDLDVLISFEPGAGRTLFDLVRMKDEVEAFTGRPVDLVTRSAVERSANPIRRASILGTARTVYAAP